MQNADDAAATRIVFIADHRSRRQLVPPAKSTVDEALRDDRSYIDADGRANWHSLYGDEYVGRTPALLCYNNATFTDADLDGIVHINGGSKAMDADRTGKFGLGFCCTYALTDLPVFLTRHLVAAFDPHQRSLEKKRDGLRFNFTFDKTGVLNHERQSV